MSVCHLSVYLTLCRLRCLLILLSVRNRAEIWTFFGPRKFLGRAFQKLYTRYHPCLAACRPEKFREDTHTSPEVIEAHTLNFKPNFKFSRLIFWGGPPFPVGVCAR